MYCARASVHCQKHRSVGPKGMVAGRGGGDRAANMALALAAGSGERDKDGTAHLGARVSGAAVALLDALAIDFVGGEAATARFGLLRRLFLICEFGRDRTVLCSAQSATP